MRNRSTQTITSLKRMPGDSKSKGVRECQKCLVHGFHVPLKGHKNECGYLDCRCSKCAIVTLKRVKNKLVIAQKRRLDMNKHRQRQKSSSATDSDHMDTAPSDFNKDDFNLKESLYDTDEDEHNLVIDENPPNEGRQSPNRDKRIVYCRRCQVHGYKSELRGHKDRCPFKSCWCTECCIINKTQVSNQPLCSRCGFQQNSSSMYQPPYPNDQNFSFSPGFQYMRQYPSMTNVNGNVQLPNGSPPYRQQMSYLQPNSMMSQRPFMMNQRTSVEYLPQCSPLMDSQDSVISH